MSARYDAVVPLAVATLIMSTWTVRTHADSASDPGATLKSSAISSNGHRGANDTFRAASSARTGRAKERGPERVARKLRAGLLGGLAGGLSGAIGGAVLASSGGGSTDGLGGDGAVRLSGLLGFSAVAPVGVSRVDPDDQFAGPLMGSVVGFAAGIGLASIARSPALFYLICPVASLAGAVGLSEHSRNRSIESTSRGDQGPRLAIQPIPYHGYLLVRGLLSF